jgi:hypothetical protein
MISDEAVEAAKKAIAREFNYEENAAYMARIALEAAAPHILAEVLEDAADTAETDELTTAAEVIYDLRRHASALRPKVITNPYRRQA